MPTHLSISKGEEKMAAMEGKEGKEEKQGPSPVSRRGFLKGAGLAVGGVAVGAAGTYGLAPPKEVIKEVPKEVPVEVVKEVQVPVEGVLEPAFEPEETRYLVFGT
jgi:hypothetical protein